MIRKSYINFTVVKNLVAAAENLQEAGDDTMCEEVLKLLQESINTKKVKCQK